MSRLTPLSELVRGYPTVAPQSGADLILFDEIDELGLDEGSSRLVAELRRHMRTAALARGQSAQLSDIEAVTTALETGDLPTLRNRWVVYPLDRHRRRDFVQFSTDASKTVYRKYVFVPDVEDLPDLSEGGTFLIVRAGDPGVLEIDDVRVRLRALAAGLVTKYPNLDTGHPLADVVFHQRGGTAARPTTWSLRLRCGAAGDEAVPFPKPELIEEMDLWSS